MNRNKRMLPAVLLALALTLTACAQAAPAPGAPDASAPAASSSGEAASGETGEATPQAPGNKAPAGSAGNPDETAAPGILSAFTTQDLDGGSVDQSLLSDWDLTMVNVWATFCGPCTREMPELGELAGDYADRGVQIVGLVSDVLAADGSYDETQLQTARDLVAATEADYPHLRPSQDLYGLLTQISVVPTTFFVDAEGRQVGGVYTGSRSKDQWAEVIDEMLEELDA